MRCTEEVTVFLHLLCPAFPVPPPRPESRIVPFLHDMGYLLPPSHSSESMATLCREPASVSRRASCFGEGNSVCLIHLHVLGPAWGLAYPRASRTPPVRRLRIRSCPAQCHRPGGASALRKRDCCQPPLRDGSYFPVVFLQTRAFSFPIRTSQFSALFEPAHPLLDSQGRERVSSTPFTDQAKP